MIWTSTDLEARFRSDKHSDIWKLIQNLLELSNPFWSSNWNGNITWNLHFCGISGIFSFGLGSNHGTWKILRGSRMRGKICLFLLHCRMSWFMHESLFILSESVHPSSNEIGIPKCFYNAATIVHTEETTCRLTFKTLGLSNAWKFQMKFAFCAVIFHPYNCQFSHMWLPKK